MLKKTITYEDFNGDTVSEDFFFHLSKAELVELELSHTGGFTAAMERIVAAEDGKSIIAEFRHLILSAYGKRSDDGRRFIKNQEIRDEFESSEAYSVLFMEILTDTNSAIEFITGVVPKNLAEEAAKITKAEISVVPDPKPEPKLVTKADIQEMSAEELQTLGDRVQSGEIKIEE